MKKTHWYPASIKPVRVGWYECDYHMAADLCMRFWDGFVWRLSNNPADGASGFGFCGTYDSWRGLKKPVDNEI